MVGENEHRCVIGRVIAPPTFPGIVLPRPAHGSEHVATKDRGTDVLEATRGKIVIDARRATLLANHPLESTRAEHPLVKRHPPDPERVCLILVGAGAETINRYCESMYTELGHCIGPYHSAAETKSRCTRQVKESITARIAEGEQRS